MYMKMPPGHETIGGDGRQQVCQLQRALYGAKQSGRLWRKTLDKWLTEYGFTRCMHDDCVYVLRRTSQGVEHTMLVGIWVDDIVGAASSSEIRRQFTEDLNKSFKVDDRGDLVLEWVLGLHVERDMRAGSVTLSGAARIKALAERFKVDLETCRGFDTPADSGILDLEDGPDVEPPNLEAMATARALIGALIFIASTFRPDIAHAVYRVATRMGKPTAKTVVASRRILAYLCKTSALGLRYGGSGPANITLQAIRKPFDEGHDRSCERLHAVTDANWETSRSCSGIAIMLNGGAVSWAAKKQPATALSSTEAETYAAAAATAEVVWARGLLSELGYAQRGPTTLWVDNTGAVAVASDAASIGRSRHIARRANFLQDMHESGEIEPRHLPGEDTCADALTKPLDKKRFVRLRKYLMNSRVAGNAAAG